MSEHTRGLLLGVLVAIAVVVWHLIRVGHIYVEELLIQYDERPAWTRS
jgi:hypothetical protein